MCTRLLPTRNLSSSSFGLCVYILLRIFDSLVFRLDVWCFCSCVLFKTVCASLLCSLSLRLFLVLHYHHFLSSRYTFLFSSCQISIYIRVNASGMCCNMHNNLFVSTLYVSENKEPLFFYSERGETKFCERKCLNFSTMWVNWETWARSHSPAITWVKFSFLCESIESYC